MNISEEMEKMISTLRSYESELKSADSCYVLYICPDISDKIIKNTIKHFDNHIAVNSIVGIYDTSIFHNGKTGIIFTNDGFYYRFIGKAEYAAYKDIINMEKSGGNLRVKIESDNINEIIMYEGNSADIIRTILKKLIELDKEYGQSSKKKSGKVKKIDIPEDMLNKCHAVIHTASVACGGVGTGLAQIPASDNAVIVPIQITMIVSLGAVFELNITESGAKSIIASAGATIAGRTASQFLLGWIPVLGNAINTATAAGLTETIGWIAVKNFYERWIEDRNKGRYDGMKDGYVEASGEYERKLRKQAEDFLTQKKDFQKAREEYERLLDEYEKYINMLEKAHTERTHIDDVQRTYTNLLQLKLA